MKNKYKIIPWTFLSLDYKAMEEYLNEMAKDGWMLEKIRLGFAKFRKIAPKNIKFCVHVFKGGGPLSSEKSRDVKVFRRKCEENGWNFITSQDYLQFLYAKEDMEVTPINDEEESEFNAVKKTLIKQNLLSIAFLLFSLYRGKDLYYPIKHTSLLSNIGVYGFFAYPILGLCTILMGIYTLIWIFKNSRKIKKGLPMIRPNLGSSKIRGFIMHSLVFIFLLLFIIAAIMDIIVTPNITFVSLLAPIIGVSTGLVIRYYTKKKAKEKGDGIVFAIFAIISMVIILNIGLSIYIRSTSNNISDIDFIPKGYPIVTLVDIDNKEGYTIESRYFDPGKSLIVPKHYVFWETLNKDGVKENIRINYYEIINPYFTQIVFKGKVNEVNTVLSWRRKSLNEDKKTKDLYKADNLLISEEKDEILIQKGNKVVYLSGNIDFTDEKVRDKISEMILNY